VNIRFTSSLTSDDENLIAPVLLKAIGSLLDLLPIAYAIRIDTADGHVYHQGSSESGSPERSFRPDTASSGAGVGLR
jgi:hypothetical protein